MSSVLWTKCDVKRRGRVTLRVPDRYPTYTGIRACTGTGTMYSTVIFCRHRTIFLENILGESLASRSCTVKFLPYTCSSRHCIISNRFREPMRRWYCGFNYCIFSCTALRPVTPRFFQGRISPRVQGRIKMTLPRWQPLSKALLPNLSRNKWHSLHRVPGHV